ncbi:MAG: hypothetical protein JKY49_17460 [Cohaesibacteraceae bacterium]|nr:hypothetical protein [Cohaesibacteraceae bacterium]
MANISIDMFAQAAAAQKRSTAPSMETVIRNRKITYFVVGFGLVAAYAVLRGNTWKGAAELHTVMEVAATLLAFLVAAMALVRYYTKKEIVFLIIGTGFVGTALLDGYHAVVTSTYFRPYMPSDIIQLIPWSWVASRQFLSIVMIISLWSWHRERKMGKAGRIKESYVYIFTATFTLASFLFFAMAPLPRAHYPELIFHRPEEFIPGILFGIALIGYLRKGDWQFNLFEHWLVVSLIVGFCSEVVFMSFSGSLFDFEFDMAHTLKKVSYVCVLIGLLAAMYAIFTAEENSKSRLVRVNASLEEAMGNLESENALRKEIEDNLRSREKELIRSNKELEKFAYIASHDLKEPLRKIQAFGGRLDSGYKDVLDERGRNYLERMRNAAGRMSGLITDLLAFSRIATHGDAFEHVNLTKIVEGVLSDLEIAIDENKATINMGVLPEIIGDRLQMRQLFQNLIGNAIKYKAADRDPIIDVSIEKVTGIGEEYPNREFWKIDVADNGIGFSQEYAAKVFEIFQRLHGRDVYEGTGVGLAIARRIAERHEGTITATSEPDKGATFTVHLPLDLELKPAPGTEEDE